VQGELSGTWGDVVNDNITSMIEQAIAGRLVINTWSGNSHTLTTANGTTAEARAAMLSLTDSNTQLSAAGTVVCPALSKTYIVKNGAGQIITVKTASGSGIAIPNGKTMLVYCDGTNVLEGVDHVVTLSAGTLTITGLTTFASLKGADATTVTGILDEDNMNSNSATKLVTQQSVKAYVDAQVGSFDTLAEVLANGNTTGGADIVASTDDKVQFRDAAIYINSGADGHLDVVADTEVQIVTSTLNVDAAVDLSSTLVLAGNADFNGDLDVDGTTNLDVVDIDGAVDMASTLQVDGAATFTTEITANGGIALSDNDKAKFGADDDLQIYHDGNNSYLLENGLGNLNIQATGSTFIKSSDGSLTSAQFIPQTEVRLFYNNDQKFRTTSTGINVTGTVTSTGTSVFASLDISGNIDVDGTTNLDVVDIDGAVDISGNLNMSGSGLIRTNDGSAANPGIRIGIDNDNGLYRPTSNTIGFSTGGSERMLVNSTGLDVTGTVTANAGVKVDNFTLDGTTLALSSGDMTLDGAGRIILDADTDGNVRFLNSGTLYGQIFQSTDMYIRSVIADTDLIFQGNDNGSNITALTLDMSAAGAATFNSTITLKDTLSISSTSTSGFLQASSNVLQFGTSSDDRVDFYANNQVALSLAGTGAATFNSSVSATSLDISGNIDVDGTTNLDVVDIDGAVNMATTALFSKTAYGAIDSENFYRIKFKDQGGTANDVGIGQPNVDSIGFNFTPTANSGGLFFTGGTLGEVLRLTSTGAVFNEGGLATSDFRVESDSNANMLFVDGGNNRVGIGSASSIGGVQLNVLGAAGAFNQVSVGHTANNSVSIGNHTSGDVISNLITSSSKFGGVIQGGTNGNLVVGIRDNDVSDGFFVVSGAGNQMASGYSRLRMSITPTTVVFNGSGDNTDFRVKSNDNASMLFVDGSTNRVGVGTSSPSETLSVESTNNNAILLNSPANRYNAVGFQSAGADKWWMGRADTDVIAGDAFFIGTDVGNATDAGGTSAKLVIGSSGNVGIGTASPASLVSGGSSPVLSIGGTDTVLTTGEKAGSVSFITSDPSFTGTYSDGITGEIASVSDSSVGGAYGLAFYTGTTTNSNRAERARLTSNGSLLVGTLDTSPVGNNVAGGIALLNNGSGQFSRDGGTALLLNRKSSDGELLRFNKDSAIAGGIGVNDGDVYIGTGDTTLRFADSANAVIPRGTNGAVRDAAVSLGNGSNRFSDLYLSGGVFLGGSGAANKLDDYEEGTWTPVFKDSSNNSASAGTASGTYVKIGSVVHVQGNLININTSGLTSGDIALLIGLPFVINTASATRCHGLLQTNDVTFSEGTPYIQGINNQSKCNFRFNKTGAVAQGMAVNTFSSGVADVFFSMSYQTTA